MMNRASHKTKSTNIVLDTTILFEQDPWRMIRNRRISKPPRDLRLIVHGSQGGMIPPVAQYLYRQVQALRGSSVELEILTNEETQISNSSSIWLVPLLLLPGKHVRDDIPRIAKRLRNQGVNTHLLPFLGSWPHWLQILQYLIRLESNIGNPILIHHPLSIDIGMNYLKYLSRRLNIPILSWTKFDQNRFKLDKKYSPIPYALFPNKNTKDLRQSDSISSLLEIEFLLLGLIQMLVDLP